MIKESCRTLTGTFQLCENVAKTKILYQKVLFGISDEVSLYKYSIYTDCKKIQHVEKSSSGIIFVLYSLSQKILSRLLLLA